MELYAQSFNESNLKNNDTVFVYDTVWEYETVYDTLVVYDTVFFEPKQLPLNQISPIESESIEPNFPINEVTLYQNKETDNFKNTSEYRRAEREFLHEGNISTELYFGMINHKNEYAAGDNNQADIIESATSELPGYCYGVNIYYNKKKNGIGSGIGISVFNEKFNYLHITNIVDSTINTIAVGDIKTWTDTIKYLDVNALLKGDTVWHAYYYKYDTVVYRDSNYYTYDTTFNKEPRSVINSYTLLEIPIVFSYKVQVNRLAVLLKGGVVNQIHIASKGKTYDAVGEVQELESVVNFARYNLALYSGLGLNFDIVNNIALCTDVFYQYPLWQFSEFSELGLKRQTYGLRVGLKYTFVK